MQTEIKYYIKHVYGKPNMYILNEDFARLHNALTNQYTLTERNKRSYEAFGFTFNQVLPPNQKQ